MHRADCSSIDNYSFRRVARRGQIPILKRRAERRQARSVVSRPGVDTKSRVSFGRSLSSCESPGHSIVVAVVVARSQEEEQEEVVEVVERRGARTTRLMYARRGSRRAIIARCGIASSWQTLVTSQCLSHVHRERRTGERRDATERPEMPWARSQDRR